MTTYRHSALGSAAVRMWRGWTVVVPVVVGNAVVQALLVWPPVTTDSRGLLVALAIAAYLVLLLAFGLIVAVALGVPDGRVGWAAAGARLRARWLPFVLWTTGLGVLATLGWAFYIVPGLVLLAVAVFVPFAALAGPSALRVGLGVLGRRPGRWAVTVVAVGVLGVVTMLVAGLAVFFLRGPLGAGVAWLAVGLVAAWVTVAWGLVFRNAVGPVS